MIGVNLHHVGRGILFKRHEQVGVLFHFQRCAVSTSLSHRQATIAFVLPQPRLAEVAINHACGLAFQKRKVWV